VLLGLLVLLLAALIYFLIQDYKKEGDRRMNTPPVVRDGTDGRQDFR
jgi:hypothetical protein